MHQQRWQFPRPQPGTGKLLKEKRESERERKRAREIAMEKGGHGRTRAIKYYHLAAEARRNFAGELKSKLVFVRYSSPHLPPPLASSSSSSFSTIPDLINDAVEGWRSARVRRFCLSLPPPAPRPRRGNKGAPPATPRSYSSRTRVTVIVNPALPPASPLTAVSPSVVVVMVLVTGLSSASFRVATRVLTHGAIRGPPAAPFNMHELSFETRRRMNHISAAVPLRHSLFRPLPLQARPKPYIAGTPSPSPLADTFLFSARALRVSSPRGT